MSPTLTMVPLAKIRARKGFNPRSEFADEQMAELVESVKQHGIITPLTLTLALAPDGDGRFTIIAGERRPDEKGLAAAALGERPFAYRVELLLDGVRFVATAAWPADEIAGNEPSVALHVTPSLPALS